MSVFSGDGPWLTALIFAVLFLVIFRRPLGWLIKLALRSLLGFGFLAAWSWSGVAAGLALGVNAFNAVTLGLLGLPGLGLLFLLCCVGVVDPAVLFQREDTAVLQTAAPAELPAAEESRAEKCLTLSAEQIDRAGALSAGYDAVVLPMQNEDGRLNYVSALLLAVESGASWGDPSRNGDLRALNARADLHTVAEISCLRDWGGVRLAGPGERSGGGLSGRGLPGAGRPGV